MGCGSSWPRCHGILRSICVVLTADAQTAEDFGTANLGGATCQVGKGVPQ
jgi:hypothetical protein